MENPAIVWVLHHKTGFLQGCRKCRQVLSTGTFALGIEVEIRGKKKKYLIGEDPSRSCCGEEKKLIRTFATEEEANVAQAEVVSGLDQMKSTDGLCLFAWTIPGNN